MGEGQQPVEEEERECIECNDVAYPGNVRCGWCLLAKYL